MSTPLVQEAVKQDLDRDEDRREKVEGFKGKREKFPREVEPVEGRSHMDSEAALLDHAHEVPIAKAIQHLVSLPPRLNGPRESHQRAVVNRLDDE